MTRYNKKQDELPYLLFLAVMFMCGCIVGRFISTNLSGQGLASARKIAEGLLEGNNSATTSERLFNSCSTVVKLPLLVFLLSFSAAGRLAIGPVFAIKGFLMTFFAGCLSVVTGSSALTASLCSLLPSCVFSLPCMLLLAISRDTGRDRINYGKVPSSAKYLLLLIPAVLADMYLCPILLRVFYS